MLENPFSAWQISAYDINNIAVTYSYDVSERIIDRR